MGAAILDCDFRVVRVCLTWNSDLRRSFLGDAEGRELGKYQFRGKMERATVVRAKVVVAVSGEEEPSDKKTVAVPASFESESIFCSGQKVKDRQHTIFRHCRTN